jgi:hypothetical protein
MLAHVPPGPAVEAAFLHVGNVVGNQVVSQPVAFIHRTPQRACFRLDRHPHIIPDALRVHAHCGTIGIEFQNVGAILLLGRRIRVVDIRGRTDRYQHLLAIRRELNVACPMTVSARHVAKLFCTMTAG